MNEGQPDFDLECECGYYHCEECGNVFYPMEVLDSAYEEDPEGTHRCLVCGTVLGERIHGSGRAF